MSDSNTFYKLYRVAELENLNAELLTALKVIHTLTPSQWPDWGALGRLIAKADEFYKTQQEIGEP